MKAPLDIGIGFDPKETVSFFVLAHSLLRHASRPIRILPIAKLALQGDGFARPFHSGQSTEFTFSRFLTPYYAQSPVCIFMDCDMLCRGDIWELVDLAEQDLYKDVFVVKHDYTPKTKKKFLNQAQSTYPCKNWSSVMVFNRHRMPVKRLTPAYVAGASPMELHQFHWATTEGIGSLPPDWNHLVGEAVPNPKAKLIHYTLGGPWFEETAACEFAPEWFAEREMMLYSQALSIPLSTR